MKLWFDKQWVDNLVQIFNNLVKLNANFNWLNKNCWFMVGDGLDKNSDPKASSKTGFISSKNRACFGQLRIY